MVVRVVSVAAWVWLGLILVCWVRWSRIAVRLGGTLTPTTLWSWLTMPVWTVRIHRKVFRERRELREEKRARLRAQLAEFERMRDGMPPGAEDYPAARDALADLTRAIDEIKEKLRNTQETK